MPQPTRWPSRLVLLVGLGVALAGCGQNAKWGLVPVAGKVLYKGKPLPNALVTFIPDQVKGNTSRDQVSADTDAQGNYQLETQGKAGISSGPYLVTVEAVEATIQRGGPKSRIPKRYADPRASGLAVEVRGGAPPGNYQFDLQP